MLVAVALRFTSKQFSPVLNHDLPLGPLDFRERSCLWGSIFGNGSSLLAEAREACWLACVSPWPRTPATHCHLFSVSVVTISASVRHRRQLGTVGRFTLAGIVDGLDQIRVDCTE